jgi:hypothetical protein
MELERLAAVALAPRAEDWVPQGLDWVPQEVAGKG